MILPPTKKIVYPSRNANRPAIRMARLVLSELTGFSTTCKIRGKTVAASEVQKSFLAALNNFYSTVKNTQEYLEER